VAELADGRKRVDRKPSDCSSSCSAPLCVRRSAGAACVDVTAAEEACRALSLRSARSPPRAEDDLRAQVKRQGRAPSWVAEGPSAPSLGRADQDEQGDRQHERGEVADHVNRPKRHQPGYARQQRDDATPQHHDTPRTKNGRERAISRSSSYGCALKQSTDAGGW
jgi:hypothetical protein